MTKLHELLAAEKTPLASWNTLFEETLSKFKNPGSYFSGHSKSLKMIEENPANAALEASARDEKALATNVYDTLEYAFTIYAKHEDLQYQKNATNRVATGTVMWRGKPLLSDMPVDELLGLEARISKIKQLVLAAPTLDASKHWTENPQLGKFVWETKSPEETTKTEKVMTPVVMAPATDKHPAQVQAVTKDVVVGKYTTIHRSGACTAVQKSEAIKVMDELLIEIKQARMRANETEATKDKIAQRLIDIILQPFKE